MNDDYLEEHVSRVRTLAEKADPFIKKRLLDLADQYDARLGRPTRAVRSLNSLAVNIAKAAPKKAAPEHRGRKDGVSNH